MFELDHELAQDIVDRAMAILPCNVNVMDSQGLILGSGERQRIDTRHEGAQLVLANKREVEIDEQTARTLRGVQPGINLPLMLDERLIGVLGLTGDPAQLRTSAQLVRMTAEMLVAQRHMRVEQRWRTERTEDVMAMLLGDAELSPRLLDEARELGLKPHLARVPCVFELAGESTAEPLTRWLQSRVADSWCLCSGAGTVLWCRPTAPHADDLQLLGRLEDFQVRRLGVGDPAQSLPDLRRGCRQVRDLLAYGREILPTVALLQLQRYRLPSLLWRHRDDDALDEWLMPLQRVIAKDSNGQLLATLRAWCEHDGQSQLCADSLGIHRNSLRYRMERIAELSGVDPMTLEGMVVLYLGVRLTAV
jgi:carbohydrate diacid regulator